MVEGHDRSPEPLFGDAMGLLDQSIRDVLEELRTVLNLGPDHVFVVLGGGQRPGQCDLVFCECSLLSHQALQHEAARAPVPGRHVELL